MYRYGPRLKLGMRKLGNYERNGKPKGKLEKVLQNLGMWINLSNIKTNV